MGQFAGKCLTLRPNRPERRSALTFVRCVPREPSDSPHTRLPPAFTAVGYRWLLLLAGEMDYRRCGNVLIPEALSVLAFQNRRDQVRLHLPGAESHGAEDILIDRPVCPVDIKLHRLLTEEQRDTERRPLVEGLVHEAYREAVFPMIDERLRWLLGVEVTRHKVLPRFEVVVDRLHHADQVSLALGI